MKNNESISTNLDLIAFNYHLSPNNPDMFIENICQQKEFEWIRSKLNKSLRILDLGFGDGLAINFFGDYEDYTILEGSTLLFKRAAQIVAEKHIKIKVVEGLFEKFEPDNGFDVVLASHVLEHVREPEIILKKIHSWLNPGGRLIVIVPNAESLHRRLGVNLGLHTRLDHLSPRDNLVGHLRVYDLKKLLNELQVNKFEVLDYRGFFLKVFSNFQLIKFQPEIIESLCDLSADLPAELNANLGVIAIKK